MSEMDTLPHRGSVGKALHAAGYALALAGAALMAALVVMVVLSVAGRSILGMPVYGDFELVSIGTALSVSLFLPYCHLRRGNVIVDLFLAKAPPRVRSACDLFASLVFAALAGVLTWRSALGGIDMAGTGEMSMILAIPVWWAFPVIVPALALLALCSLYTAWQALRELGA